jgi:hypothetical protein
VGGPAVAPLANRQSPTFPSALHAGAGAAFADPPGKPPQEAARGAAAPGVVLRNDVVLACVRAAWQATGLLDDSRLDSLAARARASSLLPELRLRVARTIDESGRLTLSDTDPGHYTETGAATNWIEARLAFRLDRLLFADDELSLERIRIERSELRSRTAAKVTQVLFEWQRAYALLQGPALAPEEQVAAVLRELEATSILDVMTEGWFGRYRATLKGL